jgi:hypothetical protein
VSHSSAALVYNVGLLDPLRWEFIIPPPRRFRPRRADVVIHRAPLAESDVEWVNGLLVTSPSRTVSDMASAHFDGGHLASVVADLINRGLSRPDDLAMALAPHAAAYGWPKAAGQELLDHLIN